MTFSRRTGSRLNGRGRIATAAGAATPETTPATILAGSGLTFRWYEAGRSETVTEVTDVGGGGNSVVEEVTCSAGSGYTSGATTTARPLIEPGGWNGEVCWRGDGSNDRLVNTNTSIATVIDGNDVPLWRYMEFQATAGGTQILWSFGNSALTTNFLEAFHNVTGTARTVRKNAGSNVDAVGDAFDLERHWLKWICDGDDVRIWVDGVDVTVTAAPNLNTASVTFDRDCLFCLGRSTFTPFCMGRIKSDLVGDQALTAPLEAELDAYFAARKAANDALTAPMLVMAGDSHTHTDTGETTWATLLAAAYPADTFINNGKPGARIELDVVVADLPYAYSHSNFSASRLVNAYVVHYGANDIESSRTLAQIKANVQTWTAAIEAAHPGVPIIGCTFHDNAALTAGEQTVRTDVNADILADPASWGFTHVLNKVGIIPEAATDGTVFDGDGKHLNATGEARLANGHNGFDGMIAIWAAIKAAA